MIRGHRRESVCLCVIAIAAVATSAHAGDASPWTALAGRSHMVFVHAPIALLLIGAILEAIARIRKLDEPSNSAAWLVVLGAAAACVAAWTGWTHADVEQASSRIDLHRWAGVATAAFAVLASILTLSAVATRSLIASRVAFIATLFAAISAGTATHLGAALVHGSRYLAPPPRAIEPTPDGLPGSTPPASTPQAEPEALAALRGAEVIVLPIAAGSTQLAVNASVSTATDISHIYTLGSLVEELDLAGRPITDKDLDGIGQLTGLRRLSLRDTQVTSASLAALAALPDLESLNLVSTGVTDLTALSGSQSLRTLYVWSSAVSAGESTRFAAANPRISVIDGEAAPFAHASRDNLPACCREKRAEGAMCTHPCCLDAAVTASICEACLADPAAGESQEDTP